MAPGSKIVVAAIDFGTTYSGYAFSFRDNPMDIRTNQSWSQRLVSMKTPTSVLINQEGQFDSFGYEAENKYAELWEDKMAEGWALFRRFKMVLYNNPDLNSDTLVEDISKRVKLPAIRVFSMAIGYMKEHIMRGLQWKKTGDPTAITQDDVFFVLTVPAIWDDRAKLLMREAAVAAGIAGDQLAIALESEAASVWCQKIPLTGLGQECSLSQPGTKYMVVDLGGGTADITVHESRADGKIHELERASGGDWGGSQVDKCYVHMLTTVMKKEIMEKFGRENIGDLFEMLREFETTKRTISSKSEGKLSFKIPAALRELYNDEKQKGERRDFFKTIRGSIYGEKIGVKGDKLRIDADLARTMFSYSISSLVGRIRHLLDKPTLKDVSTVVFVGGFAECPLVHDATASGVPDRRVVFPFEGGLAVLKGAVIYGHSPGIVATRIARFTYGIQSTVDFDPDIHPPEAKVFVNKAAKCTVAFRKYVEKKQEVTVGYTIREKGMPTSDDQTQIVYAIYISSDSSPVLTTDRSCSLLGRFYVPLPKGRTKEGRSFEKSLVFGDTELLLQVKHDNTGQVFTKYFNFM